MTVGERNQIIFLLNSHAFSTRGRRYCSRTFDKVFLPNFNELIDASIKYWKGNTIYRTLWLKGSLISRTIIMDCEAAVCVCVQKIAQTKYFSDYPFRFQLIQLHWSTVFWKPMRRVNKIKNRRQYGWCRNFNSSFPGVSPDKTIDALFAFGLWNIRSASRLRDWR
jgi:hypothetical protein